MASTRLLVAAFTFAAIPFTAAAQNLSIGLGAEPSSLDPH